MVCEACVASVRRALEPLSGLTQLSIDPVAKQVLGRVDENQTSVAQVLEQIRRAGFEVEEP